MITGWAVAMLIVLALAVVGVSAGAAAHRIDMKRKERAAEGWTVKATVDKEATAKV